MSKNCRTVNGLVTSLKKGQQATLVVWDIMSNSFDPKGAYLNLGEGRYAGVGSENWAIIKMHIKDDSGVFYKTKSKFQHFYQ